MVGKLPIEGLSCGALWPLVASPLMAAFDCHTRHEADRIILEEMAAELEAEAKKIDVEEGAKSKTVEPRQPD